MRHKVQHLRATPFALAQRTDVGKIENSTHYVAVVVEHRRSMAEPITPVSVTTSKVHRFTVNKNLRKCQ
jgi:hypothetical protein